VTHHACGHVFLHPFACFSTCLHQKRFAGLSMECRISRRSRGAKVTPVWQQMDKLLNKIHSTRSQNQTLLRRFPDSSVCTLPREGLCLRGFALGSKPSRGEGRNMVRGGSGSCQAHQLLSLLLGEAVCPRGCGPVAGSAGKD